MAHKPPTEVPSCLSYRKILLTWTAYLNCCNQSFHKGLLAPSTVWLFERASRDTDPPPPPLRLHISNIAQNYFWITVSADSNNSITVFGHKRQEPVDGEWIFFKYMRTSPLFQWTVTFNVLPEDRPLGSCHFSNIFLELFSWSSFSKPVYKPPRKSVTLFYSYNWYFRKQCWMRYITRPRFYSEPHDEP